MSQKIIVVMLFTIMNFLSQTFAPWNENTVYIPTPGTTNSCEKWIISSGFHVIYTKRNWTMAKERDKKYDRVVSIWAVLYAHILTAFPYWAGLKSFTPFGFCHDFNLEYYDELPYQHYTNFETTCEEWIKLYKFYINDYHNFNWSIAKNRNDKEDGVISLWVYVYGLLITSFEQKDTISVTDFCSIMVEKDKKMLFMSLNGTEMSCKKWIEMSGYDENVQANIKKFRRERKTFEKFKLFINSWTRYYVEYLINSVPKEKYFGCILPSEDTELMTPSGFCEDRGLLNDLVKYFG